MTPVRKRGRRESDRPGAGKRVMREPPIKRAATSKRAASRRRRRRKVESAQDSRANRRTMYKLKARGMISLADFMQYLGDKERMTFERQIMRSLVLDAQASHMGRQGPSSTCYPPSTKESASAAGDDDDDDDDRPRIVIEVDYFDPTSMSDAERRRFEQSSISIVAESR